MYKYIPEMTIDEIRTTVDIVDIISDVVMLKKAGKDFLGLCPFHSEKTPSFTVSPDKQLFYCFGCGAGGNVFSFLMKYEGISFPEAARNLAQRSGIEIPKQTLSPEDQKRIQERESLYSVLHQARDFFCQRLLSDRQGERAGIYLKNRKMAPETIRAFQLGYAPEGWQGLFDFLTRRGISPMVAENAGLIVRSKKGTGFYDRFRERIIFPIFNHRMQVCGFGGRVMDDSLPKYLNSPESPVFNKRRLLYGLHQARKKCRETGRVFVVEGYFDVLALHQHGIQNAVATLGTALTPEHVRMLKGHVKEVVLVYDSDAAGIRAARRSIDVFNQEQMAARILVLPEGDDPDSFLKQFGPEAFAKAAEAALDTMTFMMESAVRQHGLEMDGKIRIISELAGVLSDVSDGLMRTLYIRRLAERIGIEETLVHDRIQKENRGKKNTPTPQASVEPVFQSSNVALQTDNRLERTLVAMMLQFPDIITDIIQRKLLDRFQEPLLASIGRQIAFYYQEAPKRHVSDIIDRIHESEKETALRLAMMDETWNMAGCLKLIEQFEQGRQRHADDLLQRIEAARRDNNQPLLMQLLKEKNIQAQQRQSKKLNSAGGRIR